MATSDSSNQVDVKGEKRMFKRTGGKVGRIGRVAAGIMLLPAGAFLLVSMLKKEKELMAKCTSMTACCQPSGQPDVEHACGSCSESVGKTEAQQA